MILAIGVAAVLMMCALGGVVIFNNNHHASNSDTADSLSNTANETTVEIPVLTSIPRETIIVDEPAKAVEEPAKAVIEVIVVETEEAAPVDGPTIEVVEAEPAATTQTIEEIPAIVVVGEETAPAAVAETYTDDEGYETTGASDAVTEPAVAEAAAELCTVSQYGRAIATFEDFKLAIVESVENQYGYTIVEMFKAGGFTTVYGDPIDSEERFSEMADVICENDGMDKETFTAMYYDLIASLPTVDEITEEETEAILTVTDGGKAIASFEDFKSALTTGFLTGSGATVEERIMSCDFVNTDGTLIDCEEQYIVMVANICENDNITEEQFKAMVDELVEEYTEPVEGSMQVAEGNDLTNQLINGMGGGDMSGLLGGSTFSLEDDDNDYNTMMDELK